MITVGNWQLETVRGGDFSIDGGAAFGVVPKTVWRNVITPDQNNLVRFTCRCLLARNGSHTVLIDTGYGGKYPPLDRKAYLLESGSPILESLARINVTPDDIDLVLFSHLHFDHAGGATVFDENRKLVPAFPNANHMAGIWEWEDAVSRKPELIAAYPQDNLTPLWESGRLKTFQNKETILPGLKAICTGGHTRGHAAFLFEDEQSREGALFIGDLCPTRVHMRLLWNMSYDLFLLATRQKKKYWLELAAERKWWLIFPHDPWTEFCQIASHPQKEFVIIRDTAPDIKVWQQCPAEGKEVPVF